LKYNCFKWFLKSFLTIMCSYGVIVNARLVFIAWTTGSDLQYSMSFEWIWHKHSLFSQQYPCLLF
jgi:hypothetical protein